MLIFKPAYIFSLFYKHFQLSLVYDATAPSYFGVENVSNPFVVIKVT